MELFKYQAGWLKWQHGQNDYGIKYNIILALENYFKIEDKSLSWKTFGQIQLPIKKK